MGHKQHIPIMVGEILSHIPHEAKIIVDGTFGHGWHTAAFVQRMTEKQTAHGSVYAFDIDPQVVDHGKTYVDGLLWSSTIKPSIIQDSYTNILSHLPAGQKADFVLLDLGINREHITDETRGFSFQSDGPLDMRFDTTTGKTAYEIIKQAPITDMVKRFTTYGDMSEHRATAIATCISNHKADERLRTTRWLLAILADIRIHKNERAPLFQCIRIAVNHEFDNINTFIANLPSLLSSGGRCAIITFHSIEDRIIKYAFQTLVASGEFVLINKKVIIPHYTEVQRNKASRSAKLRIIEYTWNMER